MLHVGIDISSLIYSRGVSRYTANLVRSLQEQSGVKLSLFGSSGRQRANLQAAARELSKHHPQTKLNIQAWPPSVLRWWWQLGLNPVAQALPGVQVFHSWDWLQPPDKNLPLVSTIHDLAILKYPETAHPRILAYHQRAWKILKERQAQIIAVSHATKKDIVEQLDISPSNISVVYEALPLENQLVDAKLTEERSEAIKLQLKLTRPYILAVGTREPRKNLQRLIKAWAPLAKDVDLLIAGAAGWGEGELKLPAAAKDHLRFLGFVSDQQLAVLYGEAELFAYPSLYEGFGLPILEAFHYGTPVLTSNTSSMPEVAGNAAVLVDPSSIEEIRAGLTQLLAETPAQQQKRLQQMLVRQQLFSWSQVATQTLKVYQKSRESAA